MARIAANDWDSVIMTYKQLESLPVSNVVHGLRRTGRRNAVGAAERRVAFRARSLICFRTSSASLSPSRDRKGMTIVLPPVEPDLLRLGDGADDHPNAHCEELDLGDRDANVAGEGKALVEHAVENIDGAVGPMTGASL